MRWPWADKVEAATRVPEQAPAPTNLLPTDQFQVLAAMISGRSLGSVVVTEDTALGISAFFRAVSLIAGSLAALPLPTFTESATGERRRVPSIFDEPDFADGDGGQTPYEWKETAFFHLLLHGKCGAIKLRNASGGIARLPLVHPLTFHERLPTPREIREGKRPRGGLWFDVTLENGEAKTYDADDFWYVPGISLDGRIGVSLIEYARTSFATTIAGDRAAGEMFANGAMISGIATPDDEEDITDDVPEIRRQIDAAVGGHGNAGKIAVIARRLKFSPWQMNASDAQFLQSRQFQIEEISRWTGVPPHLLMQTEKQTSWGTGVEMQDRALGRTVLNPWSMRFCQRASRLLAQPRFVEFDFSALERPAPDREIEIDLQQVGAGVMTKDEYRAKRGWKPLPKTEPAPAPEPTDPPEGGEGA